ncbi:NAD(P)-dependent oxidoreductase [Sinorhizobium numidicum]|uniref:NAD(P)-dependent oxidoreductase n=1 Tax=Sinorhizobium numidicum TaxID=680248 RepID=A0ABY8D3Z2_9HYPH|nr:NAD(P)-dependent oxidoreductase [Sinorhizobium numidicum]WEX77732.1 NAD(P)-dependent oxidoreductase [Sinorhizobium numidicum]WEX84392.1 NAD(P)-dependent oxidoreductase [Sinorhizobium numidicum]
MTILVTGSAGHLGEALMRILRTAGRDARGVDIKASDFTDHVGSISDRAFVHHAMKGVRAVIHAATLHKPHVATHDYSEFVETNIAGTLNLLETSTDISVGAFVFTSTTSAFGSALTPEPGAPAAWITEDVTPIPRNIYGVSKVAAEQLCELFARRHGLATVILRTSRFFPEADDDAEIRTRYETDNAQANELLYRRADIEDVASAHLLAIEKASDIRFGRYIVSAPTPFTRADLAELRTDARTVVRRHFPECEALYAARGWHLFPTIDRVYVSARAMASLGWRPKYDFNHVLSCLRRGDDFRSPLAGEIGAKGYHDTVFADGPYPVA